MVKSKTLLAVGIAALVGAVWVVYGGALNSPFVFDDSESVTENRSITSLWPLMGDAEHLGPLNPPHNAATGGRPLVNLSLAINYHFGRLDPWGYHAFNVMIHLLSAFLLMAIVERTLRLDYFNGRFDGASGAIAFAAALLWAVHPLATETVEYVTQRTELMVALFYLGTLYASLRYWAAASEFARNFWLALATLACLAGMACKEVMVTAPVIVLLFERTFISPGAPGFRRALAKSWPLYVGLFASWGLLAYLNCTAPRSDSAGFHLGVPAYVWWLTQTKVLWMYLKLAVWPWPLSIHYELPYFTTLVSAWPWVVATALLAIATLVLFWRERASGFVGACVLVILSPTFIVPITSEVAAERRMYLPLAAMVTLFVVGAYWLISQAASHAKTTGPEKPLMRGPAILAAIGALFLAALCCVVSTRRLQAYHDNVALWQDNVNQQPDDPISHNNLGLSLANVGRAQEAITQFETTLKLKPNHAGARSNLCVLLNNVGRTQEAIEQGELALKINPASATAHNNLGNALVHAGRKQEAYEHYQEALRLKPNYADAHNNVGFMLADAGRVEDAIAQYEEALRCDPNYALAHRNLALTLLNTNQPQKAIEHFQVLVRLEPGDIDSYINMGIALAKTGRADEAVAAFQQALRLNPGSARAHSNLGLALASMGRIQEAVEQYQQAIKLQPDYYNAYANLATAFAQLGRRADAIAAAEKAMDVARSTGQAGSSQQMEDWLKTYRAAQPEAESGAAP